MVAAQILFLAREAAKAFFAGSARLLRPRANPKYHILPVLRESLISKAGGAKGWPGLRGGLARRGTLQFCCGFIVIALVWSGLGCRSVKPLPAADLSSPGWQLLQGQAVWKPDKTRPELAGELLLATNANGNYFVQLSKTPFPLVTAQLMSNTWQIEFGAGQRVWRGPGKPPGRFSWFELPGVLSGQPPSRGWGFEQDATNRWRLENFRTGETLEGEFFP